MSLTVSTSSFPYGAAVLANYTRQTELIFDDAVAEPVLALNGIQVQGEVSIVRALSHVVGVAADGPKNDAFFAQAQALRNTASFDEAVAILDSVEHHLALRTFLVGHDVGLADWMMWGALKGSTKAAGLPKTRPAPNVLRWLTHLESLAPAQAVLAALADARVSKARAGSKTASSFAVGLPDAVVGQVVTRFSPEPSGYLHIGHAKAALLSHYFARLYEGEFIIRFDDTNPTKERSEFEETILEDLRLLGIHGDRVTHTSDYFNLLHELAVQMIKSGHAYADGTDSTTPRDFPCSCSPKQHGKLTEMGHQRWHGIPSKWRDSPVAESLRRFADMGVHSEEGQRWCIRAKISVNDRNKALRDPVIYRCNADRHHRTGDSWKIYPTYDFACPLVDAIEGVTHALRTIEFHDRNPVYHWVIAALGFQKVNICDFSRLNFVYTPLSKRQLRWFVDKGLVSGWDDPRFPTVRGLRRRGLTVEAISQFMLAQGPSRAVVSLEWDSIWALNKKMIDPVAPRYCAIVKDKIVPVTLNSGPEGEVKSVAKHKKNPAMGEKKILYTSHILIEQNDAISFDDQEEITLMDWGNAIVRSKTTDATGAVTALTIDLHLSGDFHKTKKKVTWLAQPTLHVHELAPVHVALLDYDYLITKKKLEEGDNLADFTTPVTAFREDALADGNVRELARGDVLQFMRKGYFIYDGPVVVDDGSGSVMAFIRIPDGKAAGLASKVGKAGKATGGTHTQ